MRLNCTARASTISAVTDVLPTLIAVGGWLGAAAFLAGYFLVSRGRLAGDSLRYQALNIIGAVLLMTNCAYTGAWPSAVSNIFYLGVGLTIIFTVKRTYLAQLARRRRCVLADRWHATENCALAAGRALRGTRPNLRRLHRSVTDLSADPAAVVACGSPVLPGTPLA